MEKYTEVKSFIEANKRNPSKYGDEERGPRNRVRHQQKLVNKGELKAERIGLFKKLIALMEENKRVNQWVKVWKD